jgi:tRNA (cytidine/uridine-2'-O-)-methyltransferase
MFVFGKESVGLPDEVRDHRAITDQLRIPMRPKSRSINLANSVAIVLYEAWRQLGFRGGM